MVTVAIYDCDEEFLDSCVEAISSQSYSDVEILVQAKTEDSVTFRNRVISIAKGRYVTFISAKTRYAYSQVLETLVLTAEVENAVFVFGKTEFNDDANVSFSDDLPWHIERFVSAKEFCPRGGLCGALFECSFLRQKDVSFHDIGVLAEVQFLRTVAELAGKVYSFGRIISRTVKTLSPVAFPSDAPHLPIVSFIVPVYNAEKQLTRCIGSICLIPIRNIEIICVDDGSVDGSLAVLEKLAQSDDRIRVFSQANSGQGSARNRGLCSAKGRFIQFVDSDDYIDPAMYPKVLEPFYEHENLDFVQFSGEVSFDFTPTEQQRQWAKNIFKTQFSPGVHEMGASTWDSTVVWNKVYVRDFLLRNGIVFPEKTKQEDEAFTFFVFARAKRMYFIPAPWYKYVRTDHGTMSSQEKEAMHFRIPDCYKVFRFIGDFIEQEPHTMLRGYYFKRVIGATTRFNGTAIEEKCRDCAAELLRMYGFGSFKELMIHVDGSTWLRNLGHELFGRTTKVTGLLEAPGSSWHFPREGAKIELDSSPKLSYVVLLESFEQTGALTLQTLADQDESAIEIICVAFSGNDAAKDLVRQFGQKDSRFIFYAVHTSQHVLDFAQMLDAALPLVRGKYVAVLQAKEWVPSNHARVCVSAIHGQDIIIVPEVYFDSKTHLPVEQYWQYSRQAAHFPQRRAWSVAECSELCVNLDNYAHVYRTEFLRANQKTEPQWQLFVSAWLLHKLSKAKTISVAEGTSCHIRFGVIDNELPRTREEYLAQCKRLYSDLFLVLPQDSIGLVNRWILMAAFDKILWMAERESALIPVLQRELVRFSHDLHEMLPNALQDRLTRLMAYCETSRDEALPQRYEGELRKIEEARRQITPDTVIVISFLLDPFVECIDSWTFFTYLRTKGVRAKYVIPRICRFYEKVVSISQWRSDVVTIDEKEGGRSYEILDKILPFLYRTKAIVMEDGFLPSGMSDCFRKMDKLLFAFVGHGITYIWYNDLMNRLMSRFNVVRANRMEISRIEGYYQDRQREIPFRFIDASCPRYDLLPTENDATENLVLISLTWRPDLNTTDKLRRSFYFRRLVQFLMSSKWRELSAKGIKFVFSVHHAMKRTLNDDIPIDRQAITIIDSLEVSSYIRKARCLVTDLSSVAFDFIYQNKPVVFWLPDADDYELSFVSRDKLKSAQEGLACLMGYTCDLEEVFRQIERYSQNGFKTDEDVRKISERFFPHKGVACKCLYEGLCERWEQEYGQVAGSVQ